VSRVVARTNVQSDSFTLALQRESAERTACSGIRPQPPFASHAQVRRELPIKALKYMSGHDGGLFPSRVLVRQFLTHGIDLRVIMLDVKEVSRHPAKMQ
jgi:hypothetical protein